MLTFCAKYMNEEYASRHLTQLVGHLTRYDVMDFMKKDCTVSLDDTTYAECVLNIQGGMALVWTGNAGDLSRELSCSFMNRRQGIGLGSSMMNWASADFAYVRVAKPPAMAPLERRCSRRVLHA